MKRDRTGDAKGIHAARAGGVGKYTFVILLSSIGKCEFFLLYSRKGTLMQYYRLYIICGIFLSLSFLVVIPATSTDWKEEYHNGIVLYNLGQYEEALHEFNTALEINPDYAKLWDMKGYSLQNLGKTTDAIEAYNKSLEINPNNAQVWNTKGSALYDLGQYEEALIAYNTAIEIDPNHHSRFWYNKGNTLQKLGQYEEAITAYNKSLEIYPENADVWINKGDALKISGKIEEAIAAYNKALEIDSNNTALEKRESLIRKTNTPIPITVLTLIFGIGLGFIITKKKK